MLHYTMKCRILSPTFHVFLLVGMVISGQSPIRASSGKVYLGIIEIGLWKADSGESSESGGPVPAAERFAPGSPVSQNPEPTQEHCFADSSEPGRDVKRFHQSLR